ncbi:beta-N-acetylhexosaminidase [Anaeromicropila populeti]|uniref:beta-N-acetylhexosaminidase n=2 Tax=Anaeromicropila populeti TaxID=37658 RepID=A0A1I6KM23_9FIRM|nr:beta-N-acetylhexosaminidase [Anaeromicropila populeti]
MMKRILVLLGLLFLLTGCKETEVVPGEVSQSPSGQPAETEETVEEEGKVITDAFEIAGLAEKILSNMTLEEKIGQLFLVNLEAIDSSQGTFYEHRVFTDNMKESLEKYSVGGVIYFSRNIETREQILTLNQELQEASKFPLFISVDEEGGEVARLANNDNMKMTQFPSMEEVGQTKDTEYAYEIGNTIGTKIKELGFNLDFAPVADVRTNESNTEIGNRSFGSDEDLVASMVKEVVKGLQNAGVSATLKHFPGHGDAEGDTHKASVNIDNDLARLRSIDFVPFKAGIKAGVDFIMVSHISISRVAGNTTPASVSSLVMKTILREELGFEGIIITDAMDMKAITEAFTSEEAAVKAIEAGADMVLMPDNFEEAYEGVQKAVEDGKISEKNIDKSVLRILELKIKRGLILSDTNLIYK